MHSWIGVWSLLACSGETTTDTTTTTVTDDRTWGEDGPLGLGVANPFPSMDNVGDDGHLVFEGMPEAPTTPVPVDTLAWRTGFSAAQTAVVQLDGVDPAALPGFDEPDLTDGAVRLFDRTDATFLPCFAELDAADDGPVPSLLVRPLVALPYGHRIAVVVTSEVVARPDSFDATVPATAALLEELAGAGVAADDVAVTWDFPVDDGTRPLRSALEQIASTGGPSIDVVRQLGTDDVPPLTWRAAEGSYEVVDFIGADGQLDLQPDGSVLATGTDTADLYVHIPTSVADAPAGSVPVMVFGHGIFSNPGDYLATELDDNGVLTIAEEGGYIVVATTWRGLTTNDLTVAVGVASDFGKFPELSSLLLQGQINVRTLVDGVVAGNLLDHDVFEGSKGQRLPDPDNVVYYGISLGGIGGAVFSAHEPPVEAVALHVGGSMWSTMLERSSNWSLFETIMVPRVPVPRDRQILYSLSQLWWDPADPISYTADIGQIPTLMQEAIGDEQVPNLTTEALVRSVGMARMAPSVTSPWGIDEVAGPLPAGSSALTQFDPETALPPAANRPAPTSGAHSNPRQWTGAQQQVIEFLAGPDRGRVVHPCGAAPCSESNQGS